MDAGTAKTSLWRNRDFTLLWASQAVSQIGRHSSGLAFTLLVLAGGGSAVEAGAVGTVGSVVQIVMQLPGGALADRWDRRRLMVTSDAVRMCLFSLLAVSVVQERVSLPVVLVVAAGAAACDALFSPAEMAAVGQVVPGEQLPEAFAQNEARSFAAQLVGPSLADCSSPGDGLPPSSSTP